MYSWRTFSIFIVYPWRTVKKGNCDDHFWTKCSILTLTLPGGEGGEGVKMTLLQCFSKYLSNFNKMLAIPKLNIDKLKNVLKFVKGSQVFGGKGLKLG